MPFKLSRSSKRFITILAMLPVPVIILATLYRLGMDHLERQPRTFQRSLR